MSTLTRLYAGDNAGLEIALDKMKQLEIPVKPEEAISLYERLARLGGYAEQKTTPPGVKGFDLALSSCLILTGSKDPQTIPECRTSAETGKEVIVDLPRPFNILFEGSKNTSGRSLEVAVERGYRLGLYLIGKLSPQIVYIDSNVPVGSEKILAEHQDSNRVLIGRHLTADTIGNRNIGYSPGVFPSNAQEVYSYTVEKV